MQAEKDALMADIANVEGALLLLDVRAEEEEMIEIDKLEELLQRTQKQTKGKDALKAQVAEVANFLQSSDHMQTTHDKHVKMKSELDDLLTTIRTTIKARVETMKTKIAKAEEAEEAMEAPIAAGKSTTPGHMGHDSDNQKESAVQEARAVSTTGIDLGLVGADSDDKKESAIQEARAVSTTDTDLDLGGDDTDSQGTLIDQEYLPCNLWSTTSDDLGPDHDDNDSQKSLTDQEHFPWRTTGTDVGLDRDDNDSQKSLIDPEYFAATTTGSDLGLGDDDNSNNQKSLRGPGQFGHARCHALAELARYYVFPDPDSFELSPTGSDLGIGVDDNDSQKSLIDPAYFELSPIGSDLGLGGDDSDSQKSLIDPDYFALSTTGTELSHAGPPHSQDGSCQDRPGCDDGASETSSNTVGRSPITVPATHALGGYEYYNQTASADPKACALLSSLRLSTGGGTAFAIHRLVRTGQDTEDNMRLLFGPHWKITLGDDHETARLECLIEPARGSPAYSPKEYMDGSLPLSPRPPTSDEQFIVDEVRAIQVVIRKKVPAGKAPAWAVTQKILESLGPEWITMMPSFTLAMNTMDQGVPLGQYRGGM
ncbi:hypothetical protein QBC39DRAFT_363978 [Podospora conica]|nr:hypothetical protein QBC39DRAFT_363978 [Schizothecium conicum]